MPCGLSGLLKGRFDNLWVRGAQKGWFDTLNGGDGDAEIGTGAVELAECVGWGEQGADAEEAGDQSVERAAGGAVRGLGAEYIELDPVRGVEGEGVGVPDGVGDDVVHRGERAEAVASDEEAAPEGGPEVGGGQARDGFEVEAADQGQQPPPQSPNSVLLLPWWRRRCCCLIAGGVNR